MRELIVCALLLNVDPLSDVFSQTTVEEEVFDPIETETEEPAGFDILTWLLEHPLDLNSATTTELRTIPGLSVEEAEAIVQHRRSHGFFRSPAEISSAKGITHQSAIRILPFVTTVREQSNVEMRSRIVQDLQTRSGYVDGSYLGSPLKSYHRLAYTSAHGLRVGLLFEKDAGERFGNGFVSGYAILHRDAPVSLIVAGDFIMDVAQGLVLGQQSVKGKSMDSRPPLGGSYAVIRPHRSTDEAKFFRGLALSSQFNTVFGAVMAMGFVSNRRLAASLDSSGSVRSFDVTGLARTLTELGHRNQVEEFLVGGRIEATPSRGVVVGATVYGSSYDKPVAVNGHPMGRDTGILGIDGMYRDERLTLASEFAGMKSGGVAGMAGAALSFAPDGSVLVMYRNYGADFINVHSDGFGERDDTRNEKGMYIGLRIRPLRSVKVSAYADLFQFPRGADGMSLPTSGSDLFLQSEWSIDKQTDIVMRYSMKLTGDELSISDLFSRTTAAGVEKRLQRLRCTIRYNVSPELRLTSRIESSHVRYSFPGGRERGILFYHDWQWKPMQNFTLEARMIFFDTDSFDARVYEFENDLRGVFANPALFGEGRRWYLLVRYRTGPPLSLSVKYAETQKDGVAMIGTGPGEIQGDLDNRVSFQLDLGL